MLIHGLNLFGAYTWVEEGSINADTGWVFTVDAGGTLGVTSIAVTQFNSSGSLGITAGDGLTLTGNVIRYSRNYR